MIANTTTAVATARTIVQAKFPQLGPPYAGKGNGLSDQAAVLRPENDPSPMKTSEPKPAARRPGRSTTGRVAPPSPVASMSRTAPITGEPKIDAIAAKLPAAAISATAWSRRVALDRPHRHPAEDEPDRDQRAFRTEHEPQPERRYGREQDARQIDGERRRSADLEPLRRHVTAVAGEPYDRDGGQQPCERHPRQRPPERGGVS